MRQIAAALAAAAASYNGNVDSTYPYIEVPFILRSTPEILIDRNYNNTATEAPFAIHSCAGGRIKLTARHLNDGICDCCDGSDERVGDCPDSCSDWETEILERNRLITSEMMRLQQIRSDRFERGVRALDHQEDISDESRKDGEEDVATEAGHLSEPVDEEPEKATKKSISEYAKWMLPAKERLGNESRRNWFARIWYKLTSRVKTAPADAAKRIELSAALQASALVQHPEWLYTAGAHAKSLSFTSGEKTYTLENLLGLSMKENWQHLRPSFGQLKEVEILDLEKGVPAAWPTKYEGVAGPVVLRYDSGSQCRDRYYSDEKDDWIERSDFNYSARIFTVCGELDRFAHVEFQMPCELFGVLISPAACVSSRQAMVETMPSGKGRRVEL